MINNAECFKDKHCFKEYILYNGEIGYGRVKDSNLTVESCIMNLVKVWIVREEMNKKFSAGEMNYW